MLIKVVLGDEITQKRMRSKDKQDSLRTAWRAKEAVGEDSPDDGFQQGFRVRMGGLEERSCLHPCAGGLPEVPPLPWAQQGQERPQQSVMVTRAGMESLGWGERKDIPQLRHPLSL